MCVCVCVCVSLRHESALRIAVVVRGAFVYRTTIRLSGTILLYPYSFHPQPFSRLPLPLLVSSVLLWPTLHPVCRSIRHPHSPPPQPHRTHSCSPRASGGATWWWQWRGAAHCWPRPRRRHPCAGREAVPPLLRRGAGRVGTCMDTGSEGAAAWTAMCMCMCMCMCMYMCPASHPCVQVVACRELQVVPPQQARDAQVSEVVERSHAGREHQLCRIRSGADASSRCHIGRVGTRWMGGKETQCVEEQDSND